jgi:Protein of unknown function (DUF2865)
MCPSGLLINGRLTPAPDLPHAWNSPPVTSDADPNAPPRSPEPTRSEGGIAYCVRLCDGRYFPIQRHSGVSSAQTCSSFCPASATKIYNGNGIDHAVAPDGQRYSELGTAFAYRQKIIPDCTCNGRDAFGLVSPPVDDDPTLRPGDIVATNAGLMAYNGGPNGSTFTPISNYAGLSADLRRQLTETKIEPAAERPAPPPPVRQAQAPPARSTKNRNPTRRSPLTGGAAATVAAGAKGLSPANWRGGSALVREVQAAIHVARRSGLGAVAPTELIIIGGHSHRRIQSLPLFLGLELGTAW